MKSIPLLIIASLFVTSAYSSSWTMNVVNNYSEDLTFMDIEIPKNGGNVCVNYQTPFNGITSIKEKDTGFMAVIHDLGPPTAPFPDSIYVWSIASVVNNKGITACYATINSTVIFTYDLIVGEDGKVSMVNCYSDGISQECMVTDNSRCGL